MSLSMMSEIVALFKLNLLAISALDRVSPVIHGKPPDCIYNNYTI